MKKNFHEKAFDGYLHWQQHEEFEVLVARGAGRIFLHSLK